MSAAKRLPISGLLWGLFLALLASTDPVVGLVASVGSAVFSALLLTTTKIVLSSRRATIVEPIGNFLTFNAAAVMLISLTTSVALGLLFLAGMLEFEIMPVPS